jgi:hypothetical protein
VLLVRVVQVRDSRRRCESCLDEARNNLRDDRRYPITRTGKLSVIRDCLSSQELRLRACSKRASTSTRNPKFDGTFPRSVSPRLDESSGGLLAALLERETVEQVSTRAG